MIDNDVMDGMVFHMYVFHISVMRVVFSKEAGSIIVAVKRGWAGQAKTEIVEKLTKEDQFFTSMMQCDVFCIAQGVSCVGLLFGTPGDHTRAKCKAVTTDRVASVRAICMVRVGVACKGCHIVATQDEGKVPSTFDVMEDTDSHGPMFCAVAVKEGCKVANCKGNVGAHGNGKIIEGAHKLMIRCVLHPFHSGGISGD